MSLSSRQSEPLNALFTFVDRAGHDYISRVEGIWNMTKVIIIISQEREAHCRVGTYPFGANLICFKIPKLHKSHHMARAG